MVKQTFDELQTLLTDKGQQQLLRFWNQLDDDQQQELADQLRAIDFDQLAGLQAEEDDSPGLLPGQMAPPRAIRPGQPRTTDLPGESLEEAVAIGEAALRQGRVAMVLVAGGQGSRLGIPGPKGLLPIGPLSGRSLLQFTIDRVKAVSDRYGSQIPLMIMTSPSVHEATSRFLLENDHFGLDADNCRLFCQGSTPVVDARSGKILLAAPGVVALSPDGHGGMVEALGRSGFLDDLVSRQMDIIFYAQVDNPLAQVCDPALIGFHLSAQSELTSQAVKKNNAMEKTGNIVAVEDHLEVIEYSELPESLARATCPEGELRFWAGSIAVHVFSRSLLEEAARQGDWLPFHHAQKQVPFIDDDGNLKEPAEENAVKFERFIFDLLPRAKNALVVEVERASAFAPVKNADGSGQDTPTTAQNAIIALHRQWLLDAGVEIDDDVPVEIHPSWALRAEDLLEQPGLPGAIHEPTLLTRDDTTDNPHD
jgi:UDP-N-acetylglucosamine/UDP-N-acetylgalactosamine diphosphorylase